MCKIVSRGGHESLLLSEVDGVRTGAEVDTATVAYFDEREFVAVEHDQVDFADARSIVARDGSQAPPIQKTFRRTLCTLADFGRARALTAPRKAWPRARHVE